MATKDRQRNFDRTARHNLSSSVMIKRMKGLPSRSTKTDKLPIMTQNASATGRHVGSFTNRMRLGQRGLRSHILALFVCILVICPMSHVSCDRALQGRSPAASLASSIQDLAKPARDNLPATIDLRLSAASGGSSRGSEMTNYNPIPKETLLKKYSFKAIVRDHHQDHCQVKDGFGSFLRKLQKNRERKPFILDDVSEKSQLAQLKGTVKYSFIIEYL